VVNETGDVGVMMSSDVLGVLCLACFVLIIIGWFSWFF